MESCPSLPTTYWKSLCFATYVLINCVRVDSSLAALSRNDPFFFYMSSRTTVRDLTMIRSIPEPAAVPLPKQTPKPSLCDFFYLMTTIWRDSPVTAFSRNDPFLFLYVIPKIWEGFHREQHNPTNGYSSTFACNMESRGFVLQLAD